MEPAPSNIKNKPPHRAIPCEAVAVALPEIPFFLLIAMQAFNSQGN
jgi:hypothetical protein